MNITITTTTIDNALMVPISAVQSDGTGGSFVLVVTDPETQETAMRDVEMVASDGLTAVVKGQVKAGDEIVVSGGMGMGMGSADSAMTGGDGMSMSVADAGGSVVVG